MCFMSKSLFLQVLMVFETIKQRKRKLRRRPDNAGISQLVCSYVRHQAAFYIHNKGSLFYFKTAPFFK
jgi:hypothetical protein